MLNHNFFVRIFCISIITKSQNPQVEAEEEAKGSFPYLLFQKKSCQITPRSRKNLPCMTQSPMRKNSLSLSTLMDSKRKYPKFHQISSQSRRASLSHMDPQGPNSGIWRCSQIKPSNSPIQDHPSRCCFLIIYNNF